MSSILGTHINVKEEKLNWKVVLSPPHVSCSELVLKNTSYATTMIIMIKKDTSKKNTHTKFLNKLSKLLIWGYIESSLSSSNGVYYRNYYKLSATVKKSLVITLIEWYNKATLLS